MEALFGLIGVIVGSSLTWIREAIVQKKSRANRARYLAVRIICVLDEYVEKCVEVVSDDGTIMGQASRRDEGGMEYFDPVVSLPPSPIFSDDVDWKSIDGELMYRILKLPNEIRETDNHIQFVSYEIAYPPDFVELFEARWLGYAELGLEAVAITDHLREIYILPRRAHNKRNADSNPKKILEEKLQKAKVIPP